MKGILFTEILFNKTIRKEKTMTRREPASLKVINENPDDWILMDTSVGILDLRGFSSIGTVDFRDFVFKSKNKVMVSAKPKYKVGEVVYIKEPVAEYHYKVFRDGMVCSLHKPAYKYGMPEHQAVTYDGSTSRIIPREGLKFQNKMFVGSDKARYYICITHVKCERLYDISDEDCLKEGVESANARPNPWFPRFYNYDLPQNGTFKSDQETMESWFETPNGKRYDDYFDNPKESFFSLFRFANRVPKSKDIPNIWCFAYSYVLCDINGNEL